jgi:hypothetical protein
MMDRETDRQGIEMIVGLTYELQLINSVFINTT